MQDNFMADKEKLIEHIENETIFQAKVYRLTRDPEDGRYCMNLKFPMLREYGIGGGSECVIKAAEADADSANPPLANLVGRVVPFVVMGIDESTNTLICSRKKAQQAKKRAMLQKLQDKHLFRGIVTGFSRYGGYIEVNGVTGHIRNSDFSDDHSDIREYLSLGDEVEVRCREISEEGYIFWETPIKKHRLKPIEHNFEADTVVLGKVTSIQVFQQGVGAFVRLALGIDALCSLPRDVEIEEGTRVTVKIESVRPGKHPNDAPRIRGRILRAT